MTGLTPKQAECLTAIKSYTAQFGCSPSFDDIKQRIGLASKSGVSRLVRELEQRGRVRHIPGQARSIEAIDPGFPDVCDLQTMPLQALHHHIAVAAGILAHRTSGADTDACLNRIGARLAGRALTNG